MQTAQASRADHMSSPCPLLPTLIYELKGCTKSQKAFFSFVDTVLIRNCAFFFLGRLIVVIGYICVDLLAGVASKI